MVTSSLRWWCWWSIMKLLLQQVWEPWWWWWWWCWWSTLLLQQVWEPFRRKAVPVLMRPGSNASQIHAMIKLCCVVLCCVVLCCVELCCVLLKWGSNASQIHAMIEASMPTCSRFEAAPTSEGFSFIPPFHISNTNKFNLINNHPLRIVGRKVDKSVLTSQLPNIEPITCVRQRNTILSFVIVDNIQSSKTYF